MPSARDWPAASVRAASPRPGRGHLVSFASIGSRRATSPGLASGVGARSGTAPGSWPPGRLCLDRPQARHQPGTGQRRRCAQRHRARVVASWPALPRPAAGAPPARNWTEASVRAAAPRPGRGHLAGFASIGRRRATSPGLASGVDARSVTAPWSGHLVGFAPIGRRHAISPGLARGVGARSVTAPVRRQLAGTGIPRRSGKWHGRQAERAAPQARRRQGWKPGGARPRSGLDAKHDSLVPKGDAHALAPTRCQQRNAGTDRTPGIDIRLYTSGTDVIRIKSTPR
jgi:hypothetical protein